MSKSNNSRRGSKRGNYKEFWSKRAESKVSGSRGSFAKKRTHKLERQLEKPDLDDIDEARD